MDVGTLLREARRGAALTQACLAARADTAQSAVAAYESGARLPNLRTLERLLAACDHDLDVAARPRVRRGAASLAELAPTIAADVAAGEEANALRLVFGFADDFRGSTRPGQAHLIDGVPPPTGAPRFDALLAGCAEHFAAEAVIAAPGWVEDADRFVEPWWFVASSPALHAYTLAHTPAAFFRHGVFLAREVFDRA